ncbi:helix-turn-helix transcriptional regulator, partial [Escherichia coli]|uniref:helix-turn-helix transcriptional regulator n=3 Tax=Pseudomonadota TaxID=1224 RepID=UPI0013D49184
DFYRAIVFPNRVREQRQRHGFAKLLRLSAGIPEIPYIRLSKIERGEVVARPDELRRIAAALGIAPADLLLDIDSPDFDIAAWAE